METKPRKLRVAFYAPNAYPLFLGPNRSAHALRRGRWFAPGVGRQSFGGIETRAVTFARALTGRDDVDPIVIVENPAARRDAIHDGVQVVGRPNLRQQASRNLRSYSIFAPRHWWRWGVSILSRLLRGRAECDQRPDKFFRALDVDVLVAFGTNRQAAGAIASHPRSILAIAAETDVDPDIAAGVRQQTIYGEPADLVLQTIREASAIIAQTERQADLLKNGFGRSCIVIPNPIDLTWWDAQVAASPRARKRQSILWIGRADRDHKRPLVALEVAKATPQWNWTMVLNPGDPAVERKVRQTASPNVEILPRVDFASMPMLMREHTAFVSTSDPLNEGFPNVFLQAAASELPIYSLGTGQDFLARSGAGVTCISIEEMIHTFQSIEGSNSHAHGTHDARTYVQSNHASDVVVAQLVDVLKQL